MRRRTNPEVLKLFNAGRLSQADLMYVSRLKPEGQLEAAMKCLKPNPTFIEDRVDRSTINHPKTIGGKRV